MTESTGAPQAIVIELNGLPKCLSNARGNWRKIHHEKAKWKLRVVNHIIVNKLRPHEPWVKARAVFTRYSSVEPDYDNMVISWKPIADSLKTAGVIVDDSPKHFTAEYRWFKVRPKFGKIEIYVEEVK